MAAPLWEPGHLYQPGDIVQPRSVSQTTQQQPANASFESGLANWTDEYEFGTGEWVDLTSPPPDMAPNTGAFAGTHFVQFIADPSGSGPRGSVYGILKNSF